MQLPQALAARYRHLFRFYDRDGDGVHTLAGDFRPVAERINARWADRPTPVPNLLQLLLDTYAHENSRRDSDSNGSVELQEFVDSHGRVFVAFLASPGPARAFVNRAAGGFFDLLDLDLDGDSALVLADLQAFAAVYDHPVDGIADNLDAMLAELGLPRVAFPGLRFSPPWSSTGSILPLMSPVAACSVVCRCSPSMLLLILPLRRR